jgi:uncharacterized protein (TIGR02302 family)
MDTNTAERALQRIERPLRLTLLGLWAERIARSFWPMWSLALLALSAAAFGLQDVLPLEVAWSGMVAAVLGLIWALVHGIRSFARPTRTEALMRLDATLAGQPIAALLDAQATGTADPAALAVWQAHRARMAVRAANARAVEPDLRLAPRDPYALRYVAVTAIVMALLFGSIWRVTTVSGLTPGATATAATGPAWEGWAQPPAYTGKPALYLNDQTAESLTLPTGTRLQIRLYGEAGALILSETVSNRTDPPPASDAAHDFTVTQSGTLEIEGDGGRKWNVTATPDLPPTITPAAEIGREADGRFKQKFTAQDDYGVTKGQVTIALDLSATDRGYGLALAPETVAPVVLDLPLPLRGDRAKIGSTLVDDLSKHVFANLPVTLTYAATDAAGQTGTAAPIALTLPARRFFDPFAAALIEMRRDLMWNRANAPRTVQILKAITNHPEGFIRNERAYLRLRVALKRIDTPTPLTPELRDEVAEELWQIALLVEEGDLASALERLRRAQDRLDEAIRKGASPEETQQLMDEMRQALNDYMKQLGEQADPNAQTSQNDGPTIEMSQDQLQQMLDKLQQLMDEGRTAEAAELMEQLRQFMENMQVTQGQGQGQGSPGQQAMKQLGDTLRDQQGLSDDAFRDMQDGQSDGQTGPDGKTLSDRQKELADRLDQLNKDGQLPGQGSEQGESGRRNLDDANRAMKEAEQALRDGDLSGALDKQAEAMEAMRDGMRDFGEALAEENRNQGQAQDGEMIGRDDPNSNRDPLGREPGDAARIGSDRNLLQGEDIYRRAQELLDEIRKRSGEQSRPEGERDYLKRLLDLF